MSAFAEYESYDALGLADLIRRKAVKAEEVLEAAIQRVEARNPKVNAVVARLHDEAQAAIAAGLPTGPFTGVPWLHKDLGSSVGGARTSRGSQFFADLPAPAEDGVHVQRLRRAGFVIYGKSNTCEIGLSLTCEPQLFGPSHNPWDLSRTPGGSSGGASAAVGARLLPIAHASDGFGSIRAPAACCGLVGLKPTRGRNTMAPAASESMGGLSIEHAVSLTVRDSAALLDATAGLHPGDAYTAPPPARSFLAETWTAPGRLRIGVTRRAPNGATVEADALRVLDEAARLAADLGHEVEERDPEIERERVIPTFRTVAAVNAAYTLMGHPSGRWPSVGEVERATLATAEIGRRIGAPEYMAAIHTAHRIGRQMAAYHATYDVMLTPGLATLPPKLGWLDMMLEDVEEYWRRVFAFSPFTVWFNLTGQPAMMLPLGRTARGFPIAVQLVGRFGDEATLFRLGAQFEAARPWFNRKPDWL